MSLPTLTREDAIGVTLLALVSVGAYMGGIEPARVAREKAAAQEERLAQVRGEVATREQHLIGLRALLERTREQARTSIELSPPGQLSQRLTDIPAIASRRGVKLAEIQPGGLVVLDGLARQPIRFSGEGTFVDVVAFLDAMDQEMPDTEVTSLSISSMSGGEKPVARFSADVAWHTRMPGSGKGGPAPAAQTLQGE